MLHVEAEATLYGIASLAGLMPQKSACTHTKYSPISAIKFFHMVLEQL